MYLFLIYIPHQGHTTHAGNNCVVSYVISQKGKTLYVQYSILHKWISSITSGRTNAGGMTRTGRNQFPSLVPLRSEF